MNRIYKVIYSKARQCYIVVSELAKSNHKSSQQGADHTNTPALARIIAVALAAGALTWGSVPGVSWAEDNTPVTDSNGNEVTNEVTNTDSNIKDINANITGKNNKVTDSSNAEIVGDNNTVTNKAVGEDGSVRYARSDDARIHGSGNTISASRNQQVIGDNNQIIGRDLGNREENISDLTIGRGNYIRSADTGRNTWDSLKVIGNNNRADFKIESAGGPAAGIVIGDNQNIDGIQDSIVIGSLSPDEQKEQVGEGKYKSDKYFVGSNSIVVGYYATSSKDASTVIGNRSKVSGNYQTVTGLRSTIEGNYYNQLNLFDGQSGNFASIYGSFNKIEDAVTDPHDMDGVGNSINGSMNVTSNARGTMIMGVGNTVMHSKGEFLIPKDDDPGISTQDLLQNGELVASDYALGRDITGKNLTFSADQTYAIMRDVWQRYMETSGGAVSVLGNSNTSDYAIRSQILGTNNMLKGAEGNISSYNTISGFSNTGENVKRTAIVGTGNTLRNSEDNVVIGDYHNLENGKHNVILGSMASEEKAVTKTAKAAWAATEDNLDGTYTYTVNEQVALKPNPKVIKNAVMVGYNTDVTQDGGVALGADSIASTEAGKTGYDAKGKKHAKSDNDYAAWVSSDAAVSVGGADREVTYDVLDKDGNPVKEKDGSIKTAKKKVKSTRQITNLAAGTEETDAVNVAQMKVTATAAADAVKTHFYSVNSTDAKAGNYNNNGATGVNAIAAGVGASSDGDSSVAVGTNSRVASNGYSLTSIAIGKNAYVLNGTGQQEYEFGFDKDKWNKTPKGLFSYKYDPKDGQKDAALADIAGGIAIGTNSYARTGSIDIGGRTMDGRTMAGMVVNETGINEKGEVYVKNPATANIIDMTTVGTNSYNKGLMATIVGSYSINTGDFNGEGGLNSLYYGSQNMGSTIVGSLNQNRSLGKDGTSGVANSIIGVANIAEGANGALIFGAGNKVSNSIGSIYGFDGNYGANTVDDLVDSLSSAVKESESGGSTLVIGGGNTADYTQRTQLIGVNNTITGTSKNISDYNMVDGFNTTANNISHVYTIGYRNDFNNENNSIVIGDYHQLTNGKNNIVIGSYDGSYQPADEYTKTPEKTTYLTNNKLEDAVILGHNANAKFSKGVAIGSGSVASINEKVIGYDPATKKPSTVDSSTWKSTAAAVSVGRAEEKDKAGNVTTPAITRQITNVAAGTQDTDAVNVAQLKNLQTTLNGDVAKAATEVKGDKNVKATPSTVDGHTLYTLGLADTVTIGNAKAVKIDGTTGEVSGLSNITWDKDTDYSKSTKAATEAQLQKAMKDVQTAAESKDTDTHVKAGTYAVTTVKDAAGKDTQGVALDVVDKAGTPVDKVTITDVAKASDVGDVSKLATGSNTVVDAINNVNTKVDTVDKKVDTVDKKVGDLQYGAEGQTNVVTNGDSVTKAIGDLDKAIGNASTEAGKHTIVSTKDRNLTVENVAKKGEAANYQLALNKDITVDSVTAKTVTSDTVKTKNLSVSESASIGDVTINKGNQGTIDGLKNTAWDAKNITSGRAATEDQVKAATKNAVNYDDDTSKTITLREDTTIKNVANTSIEQGSKNAVNAGTVYNETRVKQDGKYVKASNTAGENLSVLDNQVASNSSNITNINGRVNNLDSKVNKVGAGAAALAALHPLDFDPEDKWDFAVGYGNYRDANSVAVGAFYRPDDDTMFSVGTNFGNGENMINAGVSFKFGPKGKSQVRPGSTQEITELRATVARQDDQLRKQDSEIKELKAMVQQLMAKQDKQAATK